MTRAGNKVIQKVADELECSVSNVYYRLDTPDHGGHDRAMELLKKYQQEYTQARPEKLLKRSQARKRKQAILRGEE